MYRNQTGYGYRLIYTILFIADHLLQIIIWSQNL